MKILFQGDSITDAGRDYDNYHDMGNGYPKYASELIKEAYPVCYGKDSRWGNHLYPIHLTEALCKATYIDSTIFMNLF